MKFSLIICTYQRPDSLLRLLESVKQQICYPDQILIIDGSIDKRTEYILYKNNFTNLDYYIVDKSNRGLTKQRNFGVSKVGSSMDLICFLDDDTCLEPNYFHEIINTYKTYPESLGVSGYISNETDWKEVPENYNPSNSEFVFDGWARTEGTRFQIRRMFSLAPNKPPGFLPDFSHGYSAGFLPPSNNIYEVEMLMGGIASYKMEIFSAIKFSPFFEGYGLYEDADFSLRASKLGKLYVNTKAKVAHYHDKNGRPNSFKYGKMVVRNGWYIWRIKNPDPTFKSQIKWHATSFLLTLLRFFNVLNTDGKLVALNESLGRFAAWFGLLFNKPKIYN